MRGPRACKSVRSSLILFNKDALAGTFFGSLGDRILKRARNPDHALASSRAVLHICAVLYVGKTIVLQGKDVRTDLFTETVAGTEILVNPDLHAAPCGNYWVCK